MQRIFIETTCIPPQAYWFLILYLLLLGQGCGILMDHFIVACVALLRIVCICVLHARTVDVATQGTFPLSEPNQSS